MYLAAFGVRARVRLHQALRPVEVRGLDERLVRPARHKPALLRSAARFLDFIADVPIPSLHEVAPVDGVAQDVVDGRITPQPRAARAVRSGRRHALGV